VAVTDRPVPPLSFGCCLQTLTDAITPSGLCFQFCNVGCHDLLADGVVCSGLIDEKHSVVLFDHALILQGQGRSLGVMVCSSATEHQISDGVGVSIGATPADGVTVRRAHPDHALLTPCLADLKSVVHIGRPVAPVRIELAPCCGLNCDGVGHAFRLIDLIIEARPLPMAT